MNGIMSYSKEDNMHKNIIVGQSGGPTSVINSSLAGVYSAGKLAGMKVYGMVHGIKGLMDRKYIDMDTVIRSELDLNLLRHTPSSFLGSCRYKLPPIEGNEAVYEQIFAILKELDIEAFFYAGGNDSMDTIKQLSDYAAQVHSDIKFMGVIKTIDNDLAVTDHAPGYGSAAKYIGTTLKEIVRDGVVYDYPTVTVVEIMGRDAGWLTAAAALARGEDCEGVDMICLPETNFDLEAFTSKVARGAADRSMVIAVSEGVHDAEGRYVFELGNGGSDRVDSFGHKQLAGTAKFLADHIAATVGCKTRAIELSSLQRCAAHLSSRVDIDEAYAVGERAVQAALEGETGKAAILVRKSDNPYHCVTDTADVHDIANAVKGVPAEWITEDYVTDELLTYVKPLIQGEYAPITVDGLPRHIKL